MHTPIPDLHHSVERPIIKSIICQLADNGVIPTWDVYNFQPNIEKRNTSDHKTPFMFKSEGYMDISADIQLSEALNIANPALQYTHAGVLPIFYDPNVRCALQPVYGKMHAEIEIKYHTTSLELLNQWRNNVIQNRMMGADRWTHKIQYGYRVPGPCGELLQYVHEAIEKKAGYGDDLSTYVHKHLIKGAKIVTGGNYIQLNIQELQTRVTGYIKSDVTIDKGDDQYTGTLRYEVWFDMPRSIISIYDVQVHQTLLPKKYLPQPIKLSSNVGILKNQDRSLLEPITKIQGWHNRYREISLTPFDDTVISDPPKSYRTVWRALLTLNKGEVGEVLCNLRTLPTLCMPEWMFCILENFKDACVLPYKAPLLFSLHRDSDLMDVTHLEIDDNLNLITKRALNLRDNWHITLSVAMAPHLIVGNHQAEFCAKCPDIVDPLKKLVMDANTGFVRRRINLARVEETGICVSPGFAMYTVESVIIETHRIRSLKNRQQLIRS